MPTPIHTARQYTHFLVRFILMFVLLMLALSVDTASAAGTPLIWYLDDVTFSNGASANGSFTFDADTNTYSDINITVINSPSRGTTTYGVPNPSSSGNSTTMIAVEEVLADMVGVEELALGFASSLTNSGGTIVIAPYPGGFSVQGTCNNTACGGINSPFDFPNGGYVTTVKPAGEIIIRKVTTNSDTTTSFTFNPTGFNSNASFNLVGGGEQSFEVDEGSYSIAEASQANWDLQSTTCNDGSAVTSINVTAGETVICTFTNLWNDVEPPIITVPSDITVGNDPGEATAVVTYADPGVTDNAPGATASCVPASGSTFDLGETVVTCTATDAAGNNAQDTFTVTVNDTENPSITVPSDITVNNDPGEATAVVTYADPGVTDNAPGATASCVPASGNAFNLGETVVTCTATDAAGNNAQDTFTVTVNDAENPTITAPSDVTVGNDTGMTTAVVTYAAPVVTDNAPGATASCVPASGSTFSLGETVVTCTATDAAGNNAQDTFTVTVNDTENPAAVCQDLTVAINLANDDVSITVADINNGSTDNVGIDTVTIDIDTFTAAQIGDTVVVTLTVTDTNSNQGTCTGDVFVTTVVDVNRDGIISPTDATYVSNRFGSSDVIADIDGDSNVDEIDLLFVVYSLGTTVGE